LKEKMVNLGERLGIGQPAVSKLYQQGEELAMRKRELISGMLE